ncbi:MAG: hypothetical protein Q4D73_02220 [Actinomycetaceae bacterium]|nr:hypothetical protein [Actinomycetaceae bacterium]
MSTPELTKAVVRVKKLLPLAALAVGAAGILVTLILQKSLLTAALAGGIGLVLALISGWTLTIVARNSQLQMAALGLDYLVKVAILIGSLLIARNVESLDQRVMGLILVVSILVQATLQVRILLAVKGPVVEPQQAVHDVNRESDSQ